MFKKIDISNLHLSNSFTFDETRIEFPPEAELEEHLFKPRISPRVIQLIVHTRYNHTFSLMLPKSQHLQTVIDYIKRTYHYHDVFSEWKQKYYKARGTLFLGGLLAQRVIEKSELELKALGKQEREHWGHIIHTIHSVLTPGERRERQAAWDKFFEDTPGHTDFIRHY